MAQAEEPIKTSEVSRAKKPTETTAEELEDRFMGLLSPEEQENRRRTKELNERWKNIKNNGAFGGKRSRKNKRSRKRN
jgi:hypothetical protein